MKKVVLNETILDAFLPMDLYGRLDMLSRPGSFALGATMEKGEEDDPAGLIVCSPDEDRLVIEWLYVMPEYRDEGIGSELLYLAFREGAARGYVDAAARISEEYETNGYGWNPKGFFENDVFSGREEGEFVIRFSFQELGKILVRDEAENLSSAKKVIRLSAMKGKELRAAVKELSDRFDKTAAISMEDALPIANREMSFALKKGSRYEGILFIRKAGSMWHPFLFSASDEETGETLLRAALYFSEDVCLPKDEIEIDARTVSVKKLLEKVGLTGKEYSITYYLCSMKAFLDRIAEMGEL